MIAKANGDVVKALRLPDIRERMSALGAEVVGSTPEQLAAFVKADTAKWARVVKQSGARIE